MGETTLSREEIQEICANALSLTDLTNKKVLVLIPDHTRHAPIDLFFRIIFDLVGKKVRSLDFLVATGTHHAESMEQIYHLVGITRADHRSKYPNVRFYNHEHDNPSALALIGTIPASEISGISGELFKEDVRVTVNKRLIECDHILIVSPVVPHESVGFSGGNKYFFPGCGGLDIIQTFHWMAAVITNPVVNGVKDTPTRRVIDRGASFIKVPTTCFAFTVDEEDRLSSLFVGEPRESWSRAADVSAKVHVDYVDKPFRQVLSITPPIYEELWVGGKAVYKMEPVVADGGEVIVYGPHIREISFVHGEQIRKVGYHVLDYFVKQWDRFRNEPKLILAHSTNVRGIGTFENGVEHPRISVTLATGIPEEVCRSVNLGYRDPRTMNLDEWRSRKDENLLVVENAGQNLYRLKN
ncbi:MAG: lactate racemase domain-containing protein [Bacteroidota bacterium]